MRDMAIGELRLAVVLMPEKAHAYNGNGFSNFNCGSLRMRGLLSVFGSTIQKWSTHIMASR